jgi:hypothetical protein
MRVEKSTPWIPLGGSIDVIVGGPTIVKGTVLLVPPEVLTETLTVPGGAVDAIAKVAAMKLRSVWSTVAVMPLFGGRLKEAPDRFVPEILIVSDSP